MGAWGNDLLSNDSAMDAVADLQDAKNKGEFLAQHHKRAKAESQENLVSKDDLPLIYEPEEENNLLNDLVSEDQDTSAREEFLGLVCFCLTDYSSLLSKNILEDSLIMVQEISHTKIIGQWREPSERLQSLLNFKKDAETELKKRN